LVGAEFRDVYCGNDYLFLEVELKDEAHNIVKFAYINGLFFNVPSIRSVKTFVNTIIVKTRAKAFAVILNNIPML
jgi:hypothetical protein